MTTMAETARRVTAGADTHRDQYVVAALDERGAELGGTVVPDDPGRPPRAARLASEIRCGRACRRRRDR